MSKNSSTNSGKHPYTRRAAWVDGIFDTKGIRLYPPLSETFFKRDLECIGSSETPADRVTRMIQTFDHGSWQTRPDNWRKLNGYPE